MGVSVSEGAERTPSVYEDAAEEIRRHVWIASEAAGCDLGERAAEEWRRRHWRGFLRACYLRHLSGERRFREFPPEICGAMEDRSDERRLLRNELTGMLRRGAENLDLLRWALDRGKDMRAVCEILVRIDINSARFPPPPPPPPGPREGAVE